MNSQQSNIIDQALLCSLPSSLELPNAQDRVSRDIKTFNSNDFYVMHKNVRKSQEGPSVVKLWWTILAVLISMVAWYYIAMEGDGSFPIPPDKATDPSQEIVSPFGTWTSALGKHKMRSRAHTACTAVFTNATSPTTTYGFTDATSPATTYGFTDATSPATTYGFTDATSPATTDTFTTATGNSWLETVQSILRRDNNAENFWERWARTHHTYHPVYTFAK